MIVNSAGCAVIAVDNPFHIHQMVTDTAGRDVLHVEPK